MLRKLVILVAALAVAGYLATMAYGLVADSTGTVSVCATATLPNHVLSVDSSPVYTFSGTSTQSCSTSTYDIPTSTTTQTETATQTVTQTITGEPPSNTAVPTISGTPEVGDTLTASPGTWSGSTPISYSYAWSDGATGQTDTLTSADVGQNITVTVTASNDIGTAVVVSAQTAVVVPVPVGPSNTTAPAISGTPQVGDTLSASQGTWTGDTPMTFAYKWSDGTTGSTDTLTSADVGTSVTVTVTATNDGGSASATSSSVGPVQPVPKVPPTNLSAPTISGTPQAGDTLTASPGTWNGDTPITYTYAWSDGATGSTDTLPASDVGKEITVTVTATNDGGTQTATSAGVGPVTAAPPPSGNECAGTSGSGTISYSSLDACGFPSPDTTGPPAGTTLTPVASASLPSGVTWSGGTLTINASNITLKDLSIPGNIVWNGSNDTLTDSVVDDNAAFTDEVVINGTNGNSITYTTVEGPAPSSNVADNGYRCIHVSGSSESQTFDHDDITNCSDGIVGNQNTSNSFVFINEIQSESGSCTESTGTGSNCAHSEGLYMPGDGSGTPEMTITHDSVFNRNQQTSAIFIDCHAYGACENMNVNDSIMEGGDYTFEGFGNPNGSHSGAVAGSGTNTQFENNRVSQLWFPLGAEQGVFGGAMDTSATTYSGNVWDATGDSLSASS